MSALLLLAAKDMTTGAWAFLLGTWGSIVVLAFFCVAKVLTAKKK